MSGCHRSLPLTINAFGRAPSNAKDLHRPLSVHDNLDEILAWREMRTVTRNLTLHYDRMMLILQPTPLTPGLARQEGRGGELPGWPLRRPTRRRRPAVPVFDKIQTVAPGAIVENKRLGAALAFGRSNRRRIRRSRRRDPRRQRRRTIWRRRVCRQRAVHRARFWQQLRPSETTPAAGCHFNFAQPMTFQPCGDILTARPVAGRAS